MLAKTFSATLDGLNGSVIQVEAANHPSLPQIQITGLPSEVIRESRERIRMCLNYLGFDVPSSRVVIHLSPAYEKKQGSQLDLAMALSVLVAEGMMYASTFSSHAFLGEVTLEGGLTKVERILPLVEALENDPRIDKIVIPVANAHDVACLNPTKVRLASTVAEAIEFILKKCDLPKAPKLPLSQEETPRDTFGSIVGQNFTKRAIEISLAGRHHLLMVGPPGVGKSLLGDAASVLLPPLSPEEYLEVAKIQSHVTGSSSETKWRRPYRAPHHTSPSPAILGGGSGRVIPGEITAAHHGVLFLDELPEFRRDVLESLREPMQAGSVSLVRVGKSQDLPARFTLIAAMNPCPCGYFLEPLGRCRCPQDRVKKYQAKVSGPLLDRFSLYCCLRRPDPNLFQGVSAASDTELRKEKVRGAFERQKLRYQDPYRRNGDVSVEIDEKIFGLSSDARDWLTETVIKNQWSCRKRTQAVLVGRTIADLEDSATITTLHLQEANAYKCPESLHSSMRC